MPTAPPPSLAMLALLLVLLALLVLVAALRGWLLRGMPVGGAWLIGRPAAWPKLGPQYTVGGRRSRSQLSYQWSGVWPHHSSGV
jgi:hypothetical protein